MVDVERCQTPAVELQSQLGVDLVEAEEGEEDLVEYRRHGAWTTSLYLREPEIRSVASGTLGVLELASESRKEALELPCETIAHQHSTSVLMHVDGTEVEKMLLAATCFV